MNHLAEMAGFQDNWIPFENVEALPEDNGEGFFSEYLDVLEKIRLLGWAPLGTLLEKGISGFVFLSSVGTQ